MVTQLTSEQQEFINALIVAMKRHPDQRAGQIIVNCLPKDANQDPYYYSDSNLTHFLRRY